MLEFIYSKKLRTNAEESPSEICGARTEPENDLRFKLIFERDIIFVI